jgi:hypothetical protein
MTEYVRVWRAKVAEESVEPFLEVRPHAISQAKRLCAELVRAELVRVGDGTWLDVLRWSVPRR